VQIIKAGGSGTGAASWESSGGQWRAVPASVTAGDYFYYLATVANGGSAIAHKFNSIPALTTTAKLASFQNNSVEKVYILNDGSVYPTTNDGPSIGVHDASLGLRFANVKATRLVGVTLDSRAANVFYESGCIAMNTSGAGVGPYPYLMLSMYAGATTAVSTVWLNPTPTGFAFYFGITANLGADSAIPTTGTEVIRYNGINYKFVSSTPLGVFPAIGDTNPSVAMGTYGGVEQLVLGPGGAAAAITGITATAVAGELKITNAAAGTGSLLAKMVLTPYIALTSGANVAVDANLSNMFSLLLAGNVTLANPTNPRSGQKITFRIKQSAGGANTVAFDTKYRFGTDITAYVMTATADKVDYITVIYESTEDKWDIVAIVKGY